MSKKNSLKHMLINHNLKLQMQNIQNHKKTTYYLTTQQSIKKEITNG